MVKIGLDMYLTAKLKTFKSYGKEKEHKMRPMLRKAFPEIFHSKNIEYIEVNFEAGYWRKVNAIHKWFVDNIQHGKDDCKDYYISRKQLKELMIICQEILTGNKDYNKELDTQSGFFFGSTDYDEWYIEDLKETIKIIKKCLKLPDEWEFEYHSSW